MGNIRLQQRPKSLSEADYIEPNYEISFQWSVFCAVEFFKTNQGPLKKKPFYRSVTVQPNQLSLSPPGIT